MEWQEKWTRAGYTKDGCRNGVDADAHLIHNKDNTPGIDCEIFCYWHWARIPTITVKVTQNAKPIGRMQISMADFDANKRILNNNWRKYGRQFYCPRKLWKGEFFQRLSA